MTPSHAPGPGIDRTVLHVDQEVTGGPEAPGPAGALLPFGGPLRRMDSKVDAVVDRLLTAIDVGEYLPGSKLPAERDLAVVLGVSRSTVREAIGRLAEEGIVRTRRGRGGGSFVTGRTGRAAHEATGRTLDHRWHEIVELVDTASRLQETVVRAAAERRTSADVVELEERLEQFRRADTGMPRQEADRALHAAICDAAHLPRLSELLARLESRISTGAPQHVWGEPEDQSEMEARALSDHEQIVALIRSGQAEQAGVLARRHALIDLDLLAQARRRRRAASRQGNGRA